MRQGFVLGQPMACDFGSQNFLDFLNSSIINTKTVTMRGARGDLPPKFPYYRSLLKFFKIRVGEKVYENMSNIV